MSVLPSVGTCSSCQRAVEDVLKQAEAFFSAAQRDAPAFGRALAWVRTTHDHPRTCAHGARIPTRYPDPVDDRDRAGDRRRGAVVAGQVRPRHRRSSPLLADGYFVAARNRLRAPTDSATGTRLPALPRPRGGMLP